MRLICQNNCFCWLIHVSFESILYLSPLLCLASVLYVKYCGVVVMLAENTVKIRLRLIITLVQ